MIKTPTIDDITSVLFVQPHPDDNEIAAGGTMALLAKKGIPVYSLTVTQGDGGSLVYTPEELREIRHQEAQNASDINGVTYLGNLGFNNLNPGTSEEITEKIVEVMRELKVQTIISCDPNLTNEIHPVHIRVGNAVNEAFMRVGQPFYPYKDNKEHTDAYKAEILGHYFTEYDNEIVDITEVYPQKISSILAHKSQIDDEFIQQLEMYYAYIASTTPYKHAERIKLLNHVHTHCFAFPSK